LLDEDGDGKDELIITREIITPWYKFKVDTAYIDFFRFQNNNFTCYKTYKIRFNNPGPNFAN
jgi:hypothetical protein